MNLPMSGPVRRRVTRAVCSGSIAMMIAALVTGCSLLAGPSPATPPRETPAVPEEPPEYVPDGSAEENLPIFTETLRDYASGESPIEGRPVVDAISGVGFDTADMQVSFDRTKTDLVADSIYVSVLIDRDCLVGQLVTEEREFAAKVMPAVGPEENICLIGETREIDW